MSIFRPLIKQWQGQMVLRADCGLVYFTIYLLSALFLKP